MNPRVFLILGVATILLGGVGFTVAQTQWTWQHGSTGSVSIIAQPTGDTKPGGDFTVPAHLQFTATWSGHPTTATLHVVSTIAVPVTVTVTGGGVFGSYTLTLDPVTPTALPAGEAVDIPLTITPTGVSTGSGYSFPITVTAHTG